jgi:hypothetical protein
LEKQAMPSLNLSEENVAYVRDEVNNLLGFQLSDEEIRTLLSGEALSFQKLVQGRSLSEIGKALIRADTLNHLPLGSVEAEEAEEAECRKGGCRVIRNPFTGEMITCFCVGRLPLEFRLH